MQNTHWAEFIITTPENDFVDDKFAYWAEFVIVTPENDFVERQFCPVSWIFNVRE